MSDTIKNIDLPKIKKTCDGTHTHCQEICKKLNNVLIESISQEYFNNYMLMLKTAAYNSCLNCNFNAVSNFNKEIIIKYSKYLFINNWEKIINYFNDDQICEIIQNQKNKNPNFIHKLLYLNITLSSNQKIN